MGGVVKMEDNEFENLKKRVETLEEDYEKLRKQMLTIAALTAGKVDKKRKG
jgi:hypothetical protein